MAAFEKMSKSRGNVVTIDEVVHGVAVLDPSCEFRDAFGGVIGDYRAAGVWRDRAGDGMYYTSTRSGRQPVLLHERGNPMPALLSVGGVDRLQHEDKGMVRVEVGPDGTPVETRTRLWDMILARFPGDD